MVERNSAITSVYNAIAPVMKTCGFSYCTESVRSESTVYDFEGEKGILRLVFSTDRLHLLSGPKEVDRSDDSAFNLDSTFLFVPDEYEERDLKSLINEISEYLTETYTRKTQIVSRKKSIQTVSRAAAKSGSLAYDPITLATKIAGMFPEIKDEIKNNLEAYDEFLPEDFFVKHANAKVLDVIKENNPQKMKKLFTILGDIYEDGTNEVQSLIAVTVLGQIQDDPILIQNIIPYLTDTMLEPVLAVSHRLKKSRSARMRLENPPKYKPKKQKQKKSFMSSLLDQQQ